MGVKVKSPTMILSRWIWEVYRNEVFLIRGKASSEPEAWRLGKDAEKHFANDK